tara:strand:- start:20 stop:664 length:645 start_codon:yes stop_codon:yes gene_type:complete
VSNKGAKMYSAKKEWAKFILETKINSLLLERKVQTWEEMKEILALAVKAEELKDIEQRGEATGKVIKNVLEYLPGVKLFADGVKLGGQVKDAMDASKAARNADDASAEKNQLLGIFHIDDGYKELVDDKLESEFIKWFPTWLEGKSGSIGQEEGDVNSVFEEFLKQRGDFDETVVNADSQADFTDIDYPEQEGEFKSAMKKAGSTLKGIFKGLF